MLKQQACLLVIFGCVLATVVSVLLLSRSYMHTPSPTLKKWLDTDGNGLITLDELVEEFPPRLVINSTESSLALLGSPIDYTSDPLYYTNPITGKKGAPMYLTTLAKNTYDAYINEDNTITAENIAQISSLNIDVAHEVNDGRGSGKPTLVTYVSRSHYNEAAVHWDEFLKYFDYIVVYSLALPPKYVLRTREKWKDRVRLVEFDFSMYPKHVRVLHNYTFKIAIMVEALREYKWCIFVDAAIAISGNIIDMLYDDMVRPGQTGTCAKFLPAPTKHSTAAYTLPKMFAFFPPTHENIPSRTQQQSTWSLLHTPACKQNIIAPLLACALYEPCMTRWNGTHMEEGNHRYDQSAMNIVTANLYDIELVRTGHELLFLPNKLQKYVTMRRRYFDPGHNEQPL